MPVCPWLFANAILFIDVQLYGAFSMSWLILSAADLVVPDDERVVNKLGFVALVTVPACKVCPLPVVAEVRDATPAGQPRKHTGGRDPAGQ